MPLLKNWLEKNVEYENSKPASSNSAHMAARGKMLVWHDTVHGDITQIQVK